MSIGGRIVEIREMTIMAGDPPGIPTRVNRLWCVDRDGTETLVFAEWRPVTESPRLGENVWWWSGWIMFDGDRRRVRKIGYSRSPRGQD